MLKLKRYEVAGLLFILVIHFTDVILTSMATPAQEMNAIARFLWNALGFWSVVALKASAITGLLGIYAIVRKGMLVYPLLVSVVSTHAAMLLVLANNLSIIMTG